MRDSGDAVLLRRLRRHYEDAVSTASAAPSSARSKTGAKESTEFSASAAHRMVEQLISEANKRRGANVYRLVAILDAQLEELAAEAKTALSSTAADSDDKEEDLPDDDQEEEEEDSPLAAASTVAKRRIVPTRLSSEVSAMQTPWQRLASQVSASDFDDAESGDDSDGDADTGLSGEARSMARTLQGCLASILAKIRRLELQELSLEDLDSQDSAYLRAERLQRQACDVYRRLCRLRGAPSAEQFSYRCGHHPQIGRLICRYVNHQGRFPDLHKVAKVVGWVNRRYKLRWSKAVVAQRAEQIFRDVGEQLQQRRWRQLRQNLCLDQADGSRDAAEAVADPADSDPALRRRLDASLATGAARLAEVMRSFAAMPERPGAQEADSGSEPSSDEDQDEESDQEMNGDDGNDGKQQDAEAEAMDVDEANEAPVQLATAAEATASADDELVITEPEVVTEMAPADSVAKIAPSGATNGTLTPLEQQQPSMPTTSRPPTPPPPQPPPQSSSSVVSCGSNPMRTADRLAKAVLRFAAVGCGSLRNSLSTPGASLERINHFTDQSQSISYQRLPMSGQVQPAPSHERPMPTQRQPIQSQRQPTPSLGQPIQSQRQPTPSLGQPIQSQRQPTPSLGQPIQNQRQPTPSLGQPIQSQRQPTPSLGQPIQSQRQPTPSLGQPIQSQRQPTPSLGQPIQSQRQPTPSLGQPIQSQRQPTSSQKQPFSNQLQLGQEQLPQSGPQIQQTQSVRDRRAPVVSGVASVAPSGSRRPTSEQRRRRLAEAVRRAIADMPQPEVIIID